MGKKSSKVTVFVIILNWNGKVDTLACLNSFKTINKQGVDLQICVVDNGSTDDSAEVIRKNYPTVALVETGENLGFSGGNNAGIAYAMKEKADYIWLLNNDTVVDTNVLSFLTVFEDPRVGACASKIYFASGHEYHHDRYNVSDRGKVFWYAGGLIDWQNMYASHRGVDEIDNGQYDNVVETPFITGCSFVVRADVISKIGVLDDRYYLYLEDLDWSIRIQKAGYKTVYAPTSVVWHVNAGSSGVPGNPLHEYYFTRNRLVFGFKYASVRTRFALFREAVRFVFGQSKIRRRAVFDALFGRLGRQYDQSKKD